MSEPRTSDVDLAFWRHAQLWLVCAGVLLVLYGYARDPIWVEQTYVEGWGSALAIVLSVLTAAAPFSVAEVVIVGAVIYELLYLFAALSEVAAKRRAWHNALLSGLFHTLDLTMILLAAFYMTWGVTYARAPAIERLGWEELAPDGELTAAVVDDLERLARTATKRVNSSYTRLHGTLDDEAITTPRKGLDIDAAVDAGFTRAGRALELHESFSNKRGPVKTPFLSELMSWFGIGGIYIPYSGEANVNGGPPAWSQVMTAAHEKGHQRMIASEDEASFYGFLACVYSDDPLLQYGAWQFARGQLSRILRDADKETWEAVYADLGAGPRRDSMARWEYWQAYEGPLEKLHEGMNDAYLKVNQVEGGVLAYGRSGRLVVAWMRSPEGRARLAQLGG